MKVKFRSLVVSATMLCVVVLASQAFATTVAVGTCTSFPSYPTISQAVSSSPAGTIVEVCPGTYPEQVTITKKITLKGVVANSDQYAPIIVSPNGGLVQNTTDVDTGEPIAAQLLVQNTSGIVIENIGVDAANNGISCGADVMGILFQSASGTIEHVAVRNQTDDPPDGCQAGEGIFVQTASASTSTVIVEDSSVHNYQKNGITGNDPGTTLTVESNDIEGWGPTPLIAQNGIQLGFGATGTVTSNTVIDDVYTVSGYGSSGILLYDALENSHINVSMNTVGNTQYPVALATDEGYGPSQYGDGVTVTGNKIIGAFDFDAIDACTNGNTITRNTIMDSFESAIHLDSSCSGSGNNTGNNNNANSNTVNESTCAGILADSGTSGNTTTPNTFYNVAFTVTSTTSGCTLTEPLREGRRKLSPKGKARKN